MSPARSAALAFVTAAVTLFVQVLAHRIVSAKLVSNFAFLVISLSMLGFALSGVLLSRRLSWFLERFSAALRGSAALFVLSALLSLAAFCHADIELDDTSRQAFVAAFLQSLPFALLLAAPFVWSGLILGALLSAPGLPARRIYCFDLAGSALGAFAVVPAIERLGAEGGLLLACATLLAAAQSLAPGRARAADALMSAAALATGLAALAPERAFQMSYPRTSMLGMLARMPAPYGVEHVRWDATARIELSRVPPPEPERSVYPSLSGGDPEFVARFRRILTQNNNAFTYVVDSDGRPESLRGIEQTLYAAAYQAGSVARPRVAVIGVGGGFDILTALAFDASQVTAVEINAATLHILTRARRELFKGFVDDPRVRLVHAEGRHYLATARDSFDVLQLSGVDSYSGTAAAAHVFSESYLYTSEAFDAYLARLTERGILNMMRLEYSPPREMLRALATAVAALRRAGARRPADHVVMLTQWPNAVFTAMLVKKTPFDASELQRLRDWAGQSRYFKISAAPEGGPEAPDTNYQRFLRLGDARREAAFLASAPFDIAPVGDDRPFFFRYSQWRHLFASDPLLAGFTPVMEYSVLLLLIVIGLAAWACIARPLRQLLREHPRPPQAARYAAVFAGAGLGYLALEIALLQKFGLLLGHPNYAMSVVLALLLLFSGLGALASRAIVGALSGYRFVAYLLAGVLLLEHQLALPRLLDLIGLPFGTRVAIVALLVAPIATCLGVFLPAALEQLKRVAPAHAPWAWGVNGVFSVMAPVLGVAFSMTWGINALFLSAVPIYLAVGLALPAEGGGAEG